jgi:hypothetical protein
MVLRMLSPSHQARNARLGRAIHLCGALLPDATLLSELVANAPCSLLKGIDCLRNRFTTLTGGECEWFDLRCTDRIEPLNFGVS